MQTLARAQKEQGKKQDEIAGEQSAQLAYIGGVLKIMQEKEASRHRNPPSGEFSLKN
jgi:hypothetical protein